MLLEVKDLRKSFDQKEVLHGVNFTVESGRALGLLGRNGAGKTTTIRIMMDVFKANSGTITMDGKPFHPKEYSIGYLPEERGLYPKKKVCDQLIYLGMLRGMNRKDAKIACHKWLERLGITEYENRRLDTLSKGNQQKVQLAQTLIQDPDIIILDEPFSGLDPVNSQILKDVVKELIARNRLVVFSSHQMSYVEEFCEDIIIINKGSVAISGSLKDIKKAYGNHRLILSFENRSGEECKQICQQHLQTLLNDIVVKKDEVILELAKGVSKKDILKAVMDIEEDIAVFANYEPTLTDIFIDKAGDDK